MGESSFESRALTTLAVLRAQSPEAARAARDAAVRLLPPNASPESRALAMTLVVQFGEDGASTALEIASRLEPAEGTYESRVMLAQAVALAELDEGKAGWAYGLARELLTEVFSYDAAAILAQAVVLAGDEVGARELVRNATLLEGRFASAESVAIAARTAAAEGKELQLPPVLPELTEP